ncbi:MAG TPA: YihY/virulence factor BrkB family protein [Candidatus Polarisedimenticolaceae bacterium]|nr:YihY/virulence factor BrkB family protein [Candidatus Polarisedimenticolaceae bacterium]
MTMAALGAVLVRTGREVIEDGVPGLAAQTAYYFFFSIFPILLFAAPLLSMIGDRAVLLGWALEQLRVTVPPSAMTLFESVVRQVVFAPNAPGMISVGAVLAAWSGSNLFGAMTAALNRAYDVEESRPWWRRRLLALVCVVVTVVFLGAASTVMLAGPELAQALGRWTGWGDLFARAWLIVQYPLAFLLLLSLFWLLYWALPNVRQSKRSITVATLVAAAIWVLATLGFRAYAIHFGRWNQTYGTIGGVIVLLMWMYLTTFVLLVGGELASELERERRKAPTA